MQAPFSPLRICGVNFSTIFLLSIPLLLQTVIAGANSNYPRVITRDLEDFFGSPNSTSVAYFGVPYQITWRNRVIYYDIPQGAKALIEFLHGGGATTPFPNYEVSRHDYGAFQSLEWTPPSAPVHFDRTKTYDVLLSYTIGGGENYDEFGPYTLRLLSKVFKLQSPPLPPTKPTEPKTIASEAPSNNTIDLSTTTGSTSTTTTSEPLPATAASTNTPPSLEESKGRDNHWVATAAVGGSLGAVCVILAGILIFVLVRLLPRASQQQDIPPLAPRQAEFISFHDS